LDSSIPQGKHKHALIPPMIITPSHKIIIRLFVDYVDKLSSLALKSRTGDWCYWFPYWVKDKRMKIMWFLSDENAALFYIKALANRAILAAI
jgi:hypothetical protein